jgi:hypothetical protein
VERELTANERGILEFMLVDAEVPGGAALRAQIPHARVVDSDPSLPTWLYLRVTPDAPAADCPDGALPADVTVESPAGETTGFIIVWTKGGYLSAVEYPWVTDEMPSEFPSPDRLRRWAPDEGTGPAR